MLFAANFWQIAKIIMICIGQINTSQKTLAYKEENETKKSILMDQNKCI